MEGATMPRLCELICRNLLVSEKPGASKFMDFVRDKRQMAVLFENFVRPFYRVHTDFRVRREDIYWRWIAAQGCIKLGNSLPTLVAREFWRA